MALHPCIECRKDISDKASVCPNCGAPQPSVNTASLTENKGNSSVVKTVLSLLVIFISVFIIWKIAAPMLKTTGVMPVAKWSVDNIVGNDECTVLGNYCMRVRCAVTNVGDDKGATQVIATIRSNDGIQTTKRSTVILQPNEKNVQVFDFPEAEMNREYKYLCSSEPLP